jgi:hypothetical protein
MSNDELTKKYADRFAEPLKLMRIESVNFKPHPFMIGTKHVVHASDHCCGMLGEETMRAVPCAHPGCRSPYEAHVHDTVAMIQLTRNATNEEVQAVLKPLCADFEADGIDGFTFVETPDKFRIK